MSHNSGNQRNKFNKRKFKAKYRHQNFFNRQDYSNHDDRVGEPSNRRLNPNRDDWYFSRRKGERGTAYGSSSNSSVKENDWYKIIVSDGKNLGKDLVLKIINDHCQMPFSPVNFGSIDNAAVFYVCGFSIRNAICRVNGKVTAPNGHKIRIKGDRINNTPPISIDSEVLQILERAMGKKYDPSTRSLNLSKFECNSDLKAEGICITLNRKNVFDAIAKVIKENVSELHSLDLSDNSLISLASLSSIISSCPNVKTLVLRDNRLKSIHILDAVKGWDLEEIVLDGNPLCDAYSDTPSYISAVRAKLPKIMKLDGKELPPPILFDLETTEKLPPLKGSFFPTDEAKQLVVNFLEEFYTIYDSDDRKRLLGAYHDQSYFSLNVSKNHSPRGPPLSEYIYESRNMMKVYDSDSRAKLLKQSSLNIVSALTQLPKTQHDPNSFIVDIAHVSSLMLFTVSGIFKEPGSKFQDCLRSFSRTFVVIPNGQGYSISNDMLFVTNATEEQVKAYKTVHQPPPALPPSVSTLDGDRSRLIIQMVNQTNMNPDFSEKCLAESNWDINRAMVVFAELNVRGAIPPEAFIK